MRIVPPPSGAPTREWSSRSCVVCFVVAYSAYCVSTSQQMVTMATIETIPPVCVASDTSAGTRL